ncbi:MAG TPA: septum formation initiator family protein [Gemmatimonadetes bacterium]|jgi:cell division protein FtsB|nr:septum formation initiator family protein [Gemmatimonadota bacterium]
MKKLIVWSLLAFSIYIVIFGGEYSVFEVRRVREEQNQLMQQLSDLQAENDSLKGWVQTLEFDSATIEKIARESFGFIRDGETLYRVTQPKDTVDNS